jgi:hypothetical protein
MTELTELQKRRLDSIASIEKKIISTNRKMWMLALAALVGIAASFFVGIQVQPVSTPPLSLEKGVGENKLDNLDMDEMKHMVAAASGMGAGVVVDNIRSELTPHIDKGTDKILAAIRQIRQPEKIRVVYRDKADRRAKKAARPLKAKKAKEYKETINGEVVYLEKFEPDRGACPKGYQLRQPRVCWNPTTKKLMFL